MTSKDYFIHISIKHPDLLEGAVEYAYQFDQINREEYRYWMEKVNAIEAQKNRTAFKESSLMRTNLRNLSIYQGNCADICSENRNERTS